VLDFVGTTGAGRDLEREVPRRAVDLEVETDAEVIGVFVSLPANLGDTAALTQRVVERASEAFGGQLERIEEVALARAVGPHEDRERLELHVTPRDAPVITQPDARDERRTCIVRGHESRQDGTAGDERRLGHGYGSSNRTAW
jgi:hypothetical protein